MKKRNLFICQPLYGVPEEDVYAVHTSILMTMGEEWNTIYNYKYTDMDSDSWKTDGYLWHIGRSIQLLQNVDLVVFAPGWRNARECLAIFDICNLYDINYIDFGEEYL